MYLLYVLLQRVFLKLSRSGVFLLALARGLPGSNGQQHECSFALW
jgi:hypothetical protein